MEEIVSTKRFFESHHITLSDYWLESCIEWFRGENSDLNYTLETLHSAVYAQWLLLDLRDVEIPVLPQNIAQQKKFILNHSICLQMLQIQDISQPKYLQIQKIRNSNILVNSAVGQEEKPLVSSKRMLQLLLSDGVQEVNAIEYRPVQKLHINLKPGTKIRINGPVTIRRGQMMLEEQHVFILGGEVEDLLVPNAYENVMARALKLPENPNPNAIEDLAEFKNEEVTIRNTQNNITNYISEPNKIESPKAVVSVSTTVGHPFDQFKNDNSEMTYFDEAALDCEMEMLFEAERDMGLDSALADTKMEDEDFTFIKAEEHIAFDINAGAQCSKHMDIDPHLDVVNKQDCVIKNANQAVRISSLLQNKNNITSGRFTIEAKFKQVIRKLTVTDDSWLLKILVGDDTGDLEVKVSSNVISNLIGYVPSAVMTLRNDIMQKEECATTTLIKIIDGLKEKIMRIDGKIVISFKPGEDLPSIIELHQL
ncbi:hypothetical protein FQA39_LY09787 [Lamprigera yunnana]|nr:hypothetical protein FQA39_LY09787 [Lamprigera yunnana]